MEGSSVGGIRGKVSFGEARVLSSFGDEGRQAPKFEFGATSVQDSQQPWWTNNMGWEGDKLGQMEEEEQELMFEASRNNQRGDPREEGKDVKDNNTSAEGWPVQPRWCVLIRKMNLSVGPPLALLENSSPCLGKNHVCAQ
ncbi:hypothetical protein ACA910_002867 [Epithemia clementina (nom. ined.)]